MRLLTQKNVVKKKMNDMREMLKDEKVGDGYDFDGCAPITWQLRYFFAQCKKSFQAAQQKKKTNDNLTTFEAIMMVQRANLVETAAFYNRSILCLDAISGRNL